MPKLTQKINKIINIPDVWEWNPKNDAGTPILQSPIRYELGGGKVRVFSLPADEIGKIRGKYTSLVLRGGETVQEIDSNGFQVAQFVARCGGSSGFWEGFYGPDGEALNCTTENQATFAWDEGLRIFICNHVGALLDAEASGKATDEEKNLLTLLAGTPANASGSTKPVVAVRK